MNVKSQLKRDLMEGLPGSTPVTDFPGYMLGLPEKGRAEAHPLSDISAASVAEAFVTAWIARFGVPLRVVTDRGSQFESELFSELAKLVGFHRLRTNSYHPQTNGIVERFHQTLKTAIIARNENWFKALPVVLLEASLMIPGIVPLPLSPELIYYFPAL